MTEDLKAKSLDELLSLKKTLSKQLSSVEDVIDKIGSEATIEAFNEINALIKSYGFKTYEELSFAADEAKKAVKSNGKSKTKAKPLYRSKIDPNLTWTGRGRAIAWVIKEAADAGKTVDEYKADIAI